MLVFSFVNRIAMAQSKKFVRKNKNFTNLSSVLSKVVNKYGIDKRLREHTFMNMWPHVVGEPWTSLSKPIFFDYERNLVVAVRDSSVAQELSLRKSDILANLRKMARSVGIQIKGVRFDIKSYAQIKELDRQLEMQNANDGLDSDKRLPEPSSAELNEIELTLEEKEDLANFKISLAEGNADSKVTTRIFEIYERDLRRKAWLVNRKAEYCMKCGLPEIRLHGDSRLCGPCFVESVGF